MLAPVLRSALLEQPLSKSLLRSAYNASVAHALEFSTLHSPVKGEEGSSSTSVTSLTQSQLSSAIHLGQRSQKINPQMLKIVVGDRSFASGSEVSTTSAQGQNSWSKFRAPFGTERKSSLSPAMYTMIGVFGFSAYLNDMIYHPPRVVAMLALMMLLMYVRKF